MPHTYHIFHSTTGEKVPDRLFLIQLRGPDDAGCLPLLSAPHPLRSINKSARANASVDRSYDPVYVKIMLNIGEFLLLFRAVF